MRIGRTRESVADGDDADGHDAGRGAVNRGAVNRGDASRGDASRGDLALGRHRLVVAAALGAALLLQGAYSFVVAPEPYPAVRMPSFEGAPDRNGLVAATTLDITVDYADGGRVTPDLRELMGDFRDTAMRRSVDHVFSPSRNRTAPRPVDDPEVRSWLRERAAAVGGGRTPTAVEFCWRAGDVDVRTATYVNRPACDVTRVQL